MFYILLGNNVIIKRKFITTKGLGRTDIPSSFVQNRFLSLSFRLFFELYKVTFCTNRNLHFLFIVGRNFLLPRCHLPRTLVLNPLDVRLESRWRFLTKKSGQSIFPHSTRDLRRKTKVQNLRHE